MEDVLELYEEPFTADYPVVCFDEKPYQLLGNKLEPLPVCRGKPQRQDYEYKRGGVCSIFVAVEPKAGKRYVKVSERRTKNDFSHFMKELIEKQYPNAKKIRIVLDNLNTHTFGAFYQSFSPSEAREMAKKLEAHYTPKHGSWLNMAEIEISALTQQCLKRRLSNLEAVQKELDACVRERNEKKRKICWSFSTEKARIKMKKLYS